MHLIAKSIRILSITLAMLAAPGLATGGPRYRIEVIGHEPDDSFFQYVGSIGGLNNHGEVAFSYSRSIQVAPTSYRGVSDSFVATSAGIIPIPNLGAEDARALGITDDGLVIGGASSKETYESLGSDLHYWVPFVSQGGLTRELPTPALGFSYASAANNKGEVVGSTWSEQYGTTAFMWSETDGYEDLGDFDSEYLNVFDINERGDILIHYATPEAMQYGESYFYNPQETIIWNSGTVTHVPSSEFRINYGNALNDQGVVVGSFGTVPGVETHAYIWDETNGFRDLGLEGEYSYATDVNTAGVVIGAYADDYGPATTPFVYSEEFGRQPLFSLIENSGDWFSLESATHINDRGQIAGIGQFGYGFNNRRVYLATPIPEPELATVLGALASILMLVRRRGSR